MSTPEGGAEETWEEGDLVFSIRRFRGHYCGYVRFPSRPLEEEGYGGILTYAPVHGGITFAKQEGDHMIYGFDCAHSGDDENPDTRDMGWLRDECRRMAAAISYAARHEQAYNKTEGEERAAVIQTYHDEMRRDYGVVFSLDDNFGAMLNLLAGRL